MGSGAPEPEPEPEPGARSRSRGRVNEEAALWRLEGEGDGGVRGLFASVRGKGERGVVEVIWLAGRWGGLGGGGG